jgi:hypothetical protein
MEHALKKSRRWDVMRKVEVAFETITAALLRGEEPPPDRFRL